MSDAKSATETKISLPVFDHQPAPYSGPTKQEIVALRQEYLSPGLITYYKDPVCIVEGKMQYLWDETGKRYLDGIAGIVTVERSLERCWFLRGMTSNTTDLVVELFPFCN